MNSLISKFSLYETFRILFPGFYSVFLFNHLFNGNLFSNKTDGQTVIVILLYLILSFIAGSLIYSFDFCRIFKGLIPNLPTNLMKENHRERYENMSERDIEHEYYLWYEKLDFSVKIKTELQSGLYHLAVSFSLVSFIGGVIFLFQGKCNTEMFRINLALFLMSGLTAFSIVKFRLSFQWRRNYLQFREEVIENRE